MICGLLGLLLGFLLARSWRRSSQERAARPTRTHVLTGDRERDFSVYRAMPPGVDKTRVQEDLIDMYGRDALEAYRDFYPYELPPDPHQ